MVVSIQNPSRRPAWTGPIQNCYGPTLTFPLGLTVRSSSIACPPNQCIETGGRPVIIAGDTAVFFAELDEPQTEGQRLVRALDPQLVWLSHEHEPWRPQIGQHV